MCANHNDNSLKPGSSVVKFEEKKEDTFNNWPLRNNLPFFPMLMKLCENDHLMRWLFSQSFIRIGQKVCIF